MIERGQIYRSALPISEESEDGYVRIQVISEARRDFCGSWVQVATIRVPDGRLMRQRSLSTSQLHSSPTTKSGSDRRTGWILVRGE